MSKKYKPTVRDIVLGKQISKDVISRSKNLDNFTREIIEERKNRTIKDFKPARTTKEKALIEEALRIGKSSPQSGVKTNYAFQK